MNDPDLKLLIGLVLVIVLGGTAWYFWDEIFAPPEPEPVVSAPAPSEPGVAPGPRYPMPEPLGAPTTGDLVELPDLDDSDSYFLLEIGATFGPAIEALLLRDGVIDRLVATVDNLPRSQLPEQIRPVSQLQEPFRPDTGDADTFILSFGSYTRYEALVAQIYYADIDAVYDTYRRYYPLFQKAYERLGYPNAYFNDRLIEVIDHLVATPMPEGPIVLTRPNVLYEFADPDLEALSSGQKLMLRIGPDNAATIKRLLQKFRARLVQP
jgi:hypothetical protein